MSDTPPKAPETTPKKPRQGRSPAFPFMSLGKALERAETFRVAEGGRPKHFTPLAAACKAWGIGAQTGTAIQTVAALGHFGLFEFEGSGGLRAARLTDLAFSILLDKQPTSAERDAAIQLAAMLPKIHAELWAKWQAALPSDPTIETFLVRDRGFSEGGARDLIAEYKETLAFAKLNQPANIPAESVAIEGTNPQVVATSVNKGGIGQNPPPPPPAGKVEVMEGERVAFTEELQPGNYLKLLASGDLNDFLLEALEDFVKRQRKRLEAAARLVSYSGGSFVPVTGTYSVTHHGHKGPTQITATKGDMFPLCSDCVHDELEVLYNLV